MENISSSLEHTLKLCFSKMVTYDGNVKDHKFQRNFHGCTKKSIFK